MSSPPTAHEIEAAMTRAVAHRRAIYARDPAYAGHTNLVERVSGVTSHPRAGDGDWWQIGSVVDTITGEELVVWYRPRRLRIVERSRLDPVPPRDASQLPCIYRAQFGWVDRETGQYVPEPQETPGGPETRFPAWLR